MITRCSASAAFAALLVIATASAALAQDKLKIAVGQRGNWDTSIPELGHRAGIFARHGIDLDILYASGGGETLQAVISGSTDIGGSVGILSVLGTFQKGAPIRVISAQATGAREMYFYVKADSPIKTLKDTDGRTVAYSANGSSSHGIVLALIKQMDLKIKTVAGGQQPAVLTGVMSGQLDVGYAIPPFGLEQLDKNEIRQIATGYDAEVFRNQTIRVNVANANALATRKDLIVRYMKAYRETIDFMYADPKALELYAAFIGITPAIAKRVRDTYFPREMVDPDKITGLDLVMADAVGMKFLPVPLDAAQVSTLVQIVPR